MKSNSSTKTYWIAGVLAVFAAMMFAVKPVRAQELTGASKKDSVHTQEMRYLQKYLAERGDEGYFTIRSVEVTPITEMDLSPTNRWSPASLKFMDRTAVSTQKPQSTDDGGIDISEIVNLGKQLWEIVKANKPVANYQADSANALPKGVDGWEQLQGWQTPKSRVFKVTYKNLFGMTVVDFAFRVIYTYGGNVKGKGHFLNHVTLLPAQLDVAWGFTFNADGKVPSVVNAGTSEDPMAGMELSMKWSVDTVLKHSENTSSFYVRGDGAFQDLTNGNFLM